MKMSVVTFISYIFLNTFLLIYNKTQQEKKHHFLYFALFQVFVMIFVQSVRASNRKRKTAGSMRMLGKSHSCVNGKDT